VARHPLYRKIRDDLFYLLVVGFIRFLRLLPRRAGLALMRTLARLGFALAAGPRRRTIEHLSLVYGKEKSPAEIRRLARRVFVHFATAATDLLRLPVLIRQGLDRLVSASGTEHLDRAFATGDGLLMITCHFGNWEILGAWLAQHGYRMSVVGTSLFDPRLDRILVETRNSAGYTNIARGKGTREIIRTLKKGEAVGMLIDQDTKADGVFVDFFGRPAYTPTGPAVLARRLDLPIIPIFAYLKADFTYQVECLPPLELARTDDEAHDIRVNTQKCSDAYEAMIRRFPEQWVWMHKRWKTRPEQFAQAQTGDRG
jgi:KDO2-lipid IV(A) lauroyltransferase